LKTALRMKVSGSGSSSKASDRRADQDTARGPGRADVQAVTRDELVEQFARWGLPRYRADQLLAGVHVQLAVGWDEITNLPRELRARLSESYAFEPLELVTRQGANDSTQKFLWRLQDQTLVESVLIPANPALYGDASDRRTLCVSTQVGCAYGCRFCASGLAGWKRNLTAAEIVGQVLAAERLAREPSAVSGGETEARPAPRGRVINNLVIMGMGEPFANYEQLLRALRVLNAPWGGRLGARKITVSTSGLVPQILRFAREPEQFGLAISLHGTTDVVREKIMPVNRKYPLRDLISACEAYVKAKGRRLTFEYILIAGVNDQRDDADRLGALARRLSAMVNLIPYNEVRGLPWQRPADSAQETFLRAVERQRVAVTLRREKGRDIDAACGQLRLRTEAGTGAGAGAEVEG
jgi:23S rRNA (adenine2503-C2)-methyltransferase